MTSRADTGEGGFIATDALAILGDVAQAPSVASILAGTHETLGMELAYLTSHGRETQRILFTSGDDASFGLGRDTELRHEETYCSRMLAARLPSLVPDMASEDRGRGLAITERARIGAFASAPVRLSGGRLFGTLCAASHYSLPELGYGHLQCLRVYARLMSDQLELAMLRGDHAAADESAARADPPLAERLDAIRGELMDLVSRHVGVGAREGGDGLSAGDDDALLGAANMLGRVARHLSEPGARKPAGL